MTCFGIIPPMKTNLLKKEKGVEGKVCVVTGAARFLRSGDAAFITGVTLPVDGGFMCYSGV